MLLGLQITEVEGMRETNILGQLMEVFVLGETKKWNNHATYDFLANVWGDITRVCPLEYHLSLLSVSRGAEIFTDTNN